MAEASQKPQNTWNLAAHSGRTYREFSAGDGGKAVAYHLASRINARTTHRRENDDT